MSRSFCRIDRIVLMMVRISVRIVITRMVKIVTRMVEIATKIVRIVTRMVRIVARIDYGLLQKVTYLLPKVPSGWFINCSKRATSKTFWKLIF